MKRILLVAAATAFTAAPTAAATTTLGSNLATVPDSANTCLGPQAEYGCTRMQTALPGRTLVAPAAGVVTRWRVRTGGCGAGGGDAQNMRLRIVHAPILPTGSYTGAGTSKPEFVPKTGSHSFATRLPIRFGDRIGLDLSRSPKFACVHVATANATAREFEPVLVDAEPFRAPGPSIPNIELALNADVEPDADADGYGDETQDGCLGVKGSEGGCPPAPSPPPGGSTPGGAQPDPAPTLGRVRMQHRRFRVGGKSTPRSAVHRRHTPVGTAFLFALSEPSKVTVAIERAGSGRRARRHGRRLCVKPTRGNRKAHECTRYKRAGALTRSLEAGSVRVAFAGRIGRRALQPGRYRATLRAVDAAGNRSALRRVAFRIVRG